MKENIIGSKFILFFSLFCILAPAFTACKSKPQVKSVYAGVANVFIVANDNNLFGAGYNKGGQLGTKGETSGFVGISHDGKAVTKVKAVSAGENHTVIVREDGSLWGAGVSLYGELGLGGDGKKELSGLTNLNITGVKTSAAGDNCTFIIKNDGTLWAAGFNFYGELGLGDNENRFVFTKVESAGTDVKEVASGSRHTLILKNDGTVWTAGYNFNGQLGLGNNTDTFNFTQVRSLGSDVISVAAGSHHSVILKKDGTVWTTGENYYEQLGKKDNIDTNQFTQVAKDAKDIAARGNLTLVLSKDNSLFLAGSFADPLPRDENNLPPEKAGSGNNASSFTALESDADKKDLKDIKKIVLGNQSIYKITGKNQLFAAGSNRYGQLNNTEITGASLKLINIYP